MKPFLRAILFFGTHFVFTLTGILLVAQGLLIGEGEMLPWIWLFGFAVLFANVVYLFQMSVLSLFIKDRPLFETDFQDFPKTALCYFIRHEDTDLLYERMNWSFERNALPNLDFWILSDSDKDFEEKELELFEKLKQKFGSRVHYRRRPIAIERKQGNVRDFTLSHPEYEFLYICDADSMVPEGVVLKLLMKALHPENQDVAIFQTFIRTANVATYYAKFEGLAAESSQKLYFRTFQNFFGKTISFGHHLLARRESLEKIDLPKGLLSHDNWDTALLDQMGYRVVFCFDVTAFDEAPAHYLESRKRESRWAKGTLQGWPILFMDRVSIPVWFLTFYGLYCYFAQPVFLIWILAGLLAQSYWWGELMSFGTDSIIFTLYANKIVFCVLLFSLLVVFFHKLVIVRNKNSFKDFLYEFFFSTFVYSGNFLYVTFDLLMMPLKKLIWQPMKKDPFEKLSFAEVLKTLWTGTLFGLVGLWFLFNGSPYPKYSALPVFVALTLSVPFVFLTGKSMKKENYT